MGVAATPSAVRHTPACPTSATLHARVCGRDHRRRNHSGTLISAPGSDTADQATCVTVRCDHYRVQVGGVFTATLLAVSYLSDGVMSGEIELVRA